MNVWKNTIVALLMTAVTAVVLGLGYPLAVTAIAQALFSDKANGQLVYREGRIVGSRLIGQPFFSAGYFRSRPSAAGAAGYDPTASGGSNFGPTNRALVDRVAADVSAARRRDAAEPVPIDLVTASGSGLDPHISPAAAEFQMARVARERGIPESVVSRVVAEHTEERELGVFGEARVNVLLLNLALDARYPMRR